MRRMRSGGPPPACRAPRRQRRGSGSRPPGSSTSASSPVPRVGSREPSRAQFPLLYQGVNNSPLAKQGLEVNGDKAPGTREAFRARNTSAVSPEDLSKRSLHRQRGESRRLPGPAPSQLGPPCAEITFSEPDPGCSPLPPPATPPGPSPSASSLRAGAGDPTPLHQPGGSDGPGSRWSPITVRWRGGRSARRAGGASWRCFPREPQTLAQTDGRTDWRASGRAGTDSVPRPSALRGARPPRGAPTPAPCAPTPTPPHPSRERRAAAPRAGAGRREGARAAGGGEAPARAAREVSGGGSHLAPHLERRAPGRRGECAPPVRSARRVRPPSAAAPAPDHGVRPPARVRPARRPLGPAAGSGGAGARGQGRCPPRGAPRAGGGGRGAPGASPAAPLTRGVTFSLAGAPAVLPLLCVGRRSPSQ